MNCFLKNEAVSGSLLTLSVSVDFENYRSVHAQFRRYLVVSLWASLTFSRIFLFIFMDFVLCAFTLAVKERSERFQMNLKIWSWSWKTDSTSHIGFSVVSCGMFSMSGAPSCPFLIGSQTQGVVPVLPKYMKMSKAAHSWPGSPSLPQTLMLYNAKSPCEVQWVMFCMLQAWIDNAVLDYMHHHHCKQNCTIFLTFLYVLSVTMTEPVSMLSRHVL